MSSRAVFQDTFFLLFDGKGVIFCADTTEIIFSRREYSFSFSVLSESEEEKAGNGPDMKGLKWRFRTAHRQKNGKMAQSTYR